MRKFKVWIETERRKGFEVKGRVWWIMGFRNNNGGGWRRWVLGTTIEEKEFGRSGLIEKKAKIYHVFTKLLSTKGMCESCGYKFRLFYNDS